jgi:hypothetical protein
VCLVFMVTETPKREAKVPSRTTSSCEWMNESVTHLQMEEMKVSDSCRIVSCGHTSTDAVR